MQISTAAALRRQWPKAEISISSPFPDRDRSYYGDYTTIRSSRRRLIFATLQIVRAWTYQKLATKMNIRPTFLISNDELRHFSEADVIIDLSGDTLTEDYGPHVTYSHFLPICLGLAFQKPVLICAQSIGPFKLTKRFARTVLNKTTMITSREEITRQYLNSLGIDESRHRKTADMAFLLEPADSERVDEILAEEAAPRDGRLTIGITVSQLVEKRFNNSTGKEFTTTIANVLDKLVEKYKAKILFVGHVTGPSAEKDDRIIARDVRAQMEQKENCLVLSGDYRPEELKGIIAACDVFLGSRMHSNIAALSSCVPTAAIGYSHKTKGIMSSLGMEEYVFDIDNLNSSDLLTGIEQLISERVNLRKRLKSGIRTVIADSEKNLAIIKDILKG